MNRKLILLLIGLFSVVATVSAGDFNINYGGSKIFTVATSGNVNATGTIAENGVLLSNLYLALTGADATITRNVTINGNLTIGAGYNLIGDGSLLTGITINPNSTTLSYTNITDIPTCSANQHLDFDGSVLSCTADSIAVNSTTISYHNITDIPTCSAGDFWTFNGSDLDCSTPSGSVSYTNLAWLNQTNTFAEENVFSKYVNITTGIRLMSNESVITREGIETTNVTIDSSGNININLG